MKTGELIRNIRTSKGIKAKTIYDGLLSRSMYYKYESGLVETTADTFLHILDRLNVDSTEFIALFEKQNNERTHYEEYRENLMTAFKQKNLNEVRLLEKKIERDYQSNQLVRFYNLKLVALAMKKHFGHHESILPERREVVHYLSRSKYWSHYEYELLADSIFMFDGSSLDKLLSDHEWFNNDDAQDIRMENLKVKVLCEAILLFIKTGRETQASLYFSILDHIEVAADNVYANGCKDFFKGLKVIEDGDYEQGIKMVSAAFALYQKLGMEELYREQVDILQALLKFRLQESTSHRQRKA